MRLTKKEKELLHRCAMLTLAGEWPWEDSGEASLSEEEQEKEKALLQSAADKLLT